MCTFCQKSVSTTTKYQVEQHIRTYLHSTNKLRIEDSRLKQKKLDNITTWDTYNKELVQACMVADIPLHKLDNEHLHAFLSMWWILHTGISVYVFFKVHSLQHFSLAAKYTNRKQPTREHCRSKYVDVNYNICLNNIREKIGDSKIWFSVDETTDSDGRNIGK